MNGPNNFHCPLCGSGSVEEIECIRSKPEGETEFNIPPDKYLRRMARCTACGVFINRHSLIPQDFYSGKYNAETYKDKLRSTFQRIMSLPREMSDNKQRVVRVHKFLAGHGRIPTATRILDIGSGLCVFLAEMKKLGYHCTCIDPDQSSVEHAIENAKVDDAFTGSVENFSSHKKFDVVTLNKVLEHVENPLGMLLKAKELLEKEGHVYLELPDADGALKLGGIIDREEFYIEHLTVFNPKSMAVLIEKAGLNICEIKQIVEPSGKATIYSLADNLK